MGVVVKSKYNVGYTYENKQGLIAEVVEYRGRKDITVEFKLDGARKVTTGSYIAKLLPLHPTFGKHFVGEKFPCHDGDTVEIIELISQTKAVVCWLSDGYKSTRELVDVRKGFNRHPIKNVPQKGDKFTSKNYGGATVLEFKSAIDVVVQFEDGVITSFPVSRLKSGNFRHPSCNLTIGSEFVTKSGWRGSILEYRDAHNVLVKWQDGSTSWEGSGDIRMGSIKPLMQPSVEGIGYFGVGKFVPGLHKKGLKAPEKIYAYWVRMFSRCYNPYELNKNKNMSYRDIHICKDWHNFQNFAEWAIKQYNTPDYSFELDKDLLSNGARIYKDEVCCFVPSEINLFLMEQDRGAYYRGVNIITPKTPNSTVGFVARCSTGGGREYLGFYPTPELAFFAYKERKEAYAKELAEKWKSQIDPRAYEALMNYTVEITD